MATLELKKVRKNYGNLEVIHGIDLFINNGEFCVLVGPSGCGKSTLLRMIAGLENITKGEILIDSDIVNNISAAKRGAAIGIEGKWAIHPSQIDLANKVFSPPEAEVNKAKRIIEELEKAAKEGKGAAQLDGRMIDAASARMAENIVNIDNLINKK